MPPTLIATQAVQGPYPTNPVVAPTLDLTFTAADVSNGNYFVGDPVTSSLPQGSVGGDVLLVTNTDTAAHTITFTSQPLNGRSYDITSYSVGAGVTSAFKYSQLAGWADVSGNVYFTATSALLLVAVLKR
jgi:hypothetical protein